MNCGLGNLESLKRHLLPSGTMAGETRFDQVMADLGQGVADDFENFCNRKFARAAGDVCVFQADRASFVLPRYPIEEITKVEVQVATADGWFEQESSWLRSVSLASGVVYLPEPPDAGPYWAQVRFTCTGGYWFEQLEPDDEGYPSAQPAGAMGLPKGLRLAWLNHCRQVWNAYDKLGAGLVSKPDVQTVIGELDYSASVKRTLGNYTLIQPI
jgi:hypothetical protein